MPPTSPRPTGVRSFFLLVATVGMWLVPGGSEAQSPPVTSATLQSGTLSFAAHATVGDFVGSTETMSGAVSGSLVSPRGWVEAPAATLVTHNERRDRDMRASLEAATYPAIRFALASTTIVSEGRGDTTAVILHGTLAIHGVTRAVDPPATIVRTGDTLVVISSFPLDLRDYRIGGLTRMFGVLRMDPMIGVHVDLRFVTTPAGRAAAGSQP